MDLVIRKSRKQSDREKLQALLDSKELRSFALPTASGYRYLCVRLDKDGGLVEEVVEIVNNEIVSRSRTGIFEVFNVFVIGDEMTTEPDEDCSLTIDNVIHSAESLVDAVNALLRMAEELKEDLEEKGSKDCILK